MMRTFQEYYREIRRLQTIYNGSVKSYKHYHAYLKEHLYDRDNKPKEPVYLHDKTDDNFLIAGNTYEYINKLNSGYAKSLRVIILIRLISNLEVFLIKVIKDIFLHRKDLFHKERMIEFKHNELLSVKSISQLWTKLINKECRNLQNQGFVEVRKYYFTSFGIDFAQSGVPIKYLEKLHDARHLLVHRLGKTDSYFQHKYNSKERTISISESDFYEGINQLKKFGNFIKEQFEIIIQQQRKQTSAKESSKAMISLNLLTVNSDFLISDEFSFISGEKFLMLKDILLSRKQHEQIAELELTGPIGDIYSYLIALKNYIKAGNIELISKNIKVSPFDWFSKQEIAFIKEEIESSKIDSKKIEIIAKKLKISKKKVEKLVEKIKKNNKAAQPPTTGC